MKKKEICDYKVIKTQNDIDELMETCNYFHDSCIVSTNYQSGYEVRKDGSIEQFGDPTVSIIFHSQWHPRRFELCFENVRKFYINGLKENYMNIIDEADICFHDIKVYDEIMGEMTKRAIIWTDYEGFDISDLEKKTIDYDYSFVLADLLKWRTIEENN